MDCTLSKSLNIKCRCYDFCKAPVKDKESEKCPVRFDYEFQSRRNTIFGMNFNKIEDIQKGVKE